MGISDKKWFRLSCPNCAAEEIDSVSDYGSQWGAADWTSVGPFAKFDVIRKEGVAGEPEIESATCKHCKKPAEIQISYAMGEPKWD